MIAIAVAVLLQVPFIADNADTQDPAPLEDFKIAFGGNVFSGFGEPFHDMLGPQLTLGHHLHRWTGPGWWVRLDLYRTESDFENPGDQVLGTKGTPVADASIDLFNASLSVEWHPWRPIEWLDLYGGLGFGFVTMGNGDARSLPSVDVEVEGNSGVEVHLLLGASARVYGPLRVTAEFRLMEIFAAFDVRDRLTGETGSLDSWEAGGFTFAIEVRF